MPFNRRPSYGVGTLYAGDTSEEIYTAAGYDPSEYYPAPGYDIIATGAKASPATQADQDAARRYLESYGTTPAPSQSFDLSGWFKKNQTVVLAGAAVFIGLKLLGGRR